ncbi:MAG TPA: LytTR family DNA-binding domain-containing protein [Steroidobacteraceae bacterium]|nr:LytTR family DNA-binding domain-containing protein [Steroidobacteraceae bacterium]
MNPRVLIVDDEPPARERLRRLLEEHGGVDIAGEAANGEQAVRLAGDLKPDLVLLDVRMPGMNGLEAARHLALFDAPPAVVFTTAYDAYAVEAFEAQAIGYLLKPVRAEKLAAALQRAARLAESTLARVAAGDPARAPRTHVAARLGDAVRLIPLPEIYYFAADQKYTTVRHRGGADLIEDSLRALEEEFPAQFVRVHRNALVAIHSLAAIERDVEGQYRVVLRDIGERLDVSRRLAGELKERFRL